MIRAYSLTVLATAGSAGSATGSGSTNMGITGRLVGVHLDFVADTPATTDTTISTADDPTVTFLTITDSATDAWYYPRSQVHGVTGTALTLDGTRLLVEPAPFSGRLKITLAGCTVGKGVTATFYVEE